MTRFRGVALAVLTVGSASACSFIGNLDQFNGAVEEEAGSNGLDAGDSGRSVKDASSDRVEKADAGKGARDGEASEGDGDDGGVAGDDGGDASDGGDGEEAGVDWCLANTTSKTYFCRDFDDGKSFGFGFATYLNLPDGGVEPSIVSNEFASAPSSLLVPAASLASSSDSEQVQLVVHVSGHTLLELHFALKLVDFSPTGGDLSLVRLGFDSNVWWVSWDLQGSSNVYETTMTSDGGQMTTTHPTTMPQLGAWVDVVFAIDVAAETVSLTLDGVSALQDTISAPTLTGGLGAGIGINYLQGPFQAMSIYYDNVAIVTN
jgi:hypothetical protein